MNERRSRANVLMDMLQVIRDNGRTRPTRILYKANLSHRLMKRHLEMLAANKFIEEQHDDGKSAYVITAKGLKFIEEFKRIKKFSEAFGLEL